MCAQETHGQEPSYDPVREAEGVLADAALQVGVDAAIAREVGVAAAALRSPAPAAEAGPSEDLSPLSRVLRGIQRVLNSLWPTRDPEDSMDDIGSAELLEAAAWERVANRGSGPHNY